MSAAEWCRHLRHRADLQLMIEHFNWAIICPCGTWRRTGLEKKKPGIQGVRPHRVIYDEIATWR